jgi:DNA polymerase I-like protein with 3'-5' exonuclease and polymerase domains
VNVIIDALVYSHPVLQQAALRQYVKEHGRVEQYAVVEEMDRYRAAFLQLPIITTPDRLSAWDYQSYGQYDIWLLVEEGVPLAKAREAVKKYGTVMAMVDRKWRYQVESQRALARDLWRWENPYDPPWQPCPYQPAAGHTDRDYRRVQDAREEEWRNGPVALDFETVGEYPFMRPVSFTFSQYPGEAIYVSIASEVEENYPEQLWRKILQIITEGQWIAHNARFEMHCLENLGITDYTLPHDTMILNWLASEPRGLKESAQKLLGERMTTFEEASKGRPWTHVPLSDGLDYACSDADMTLRLWEWHAQRLKEAGGIVWPDLYEQECHLLRALVAMERRGFQADDDGLREWGDSLFMDIHTIESKYPDTNLNSGPQVSKLLFEQNGFDPIKWAAKGYSTDEETLLFLAEPYILRGEDVPSVLADLLKHRELTTLNSRYAKGLRDKARLHGDGRIHPSYDGTGTKTGRLSSKEPNGQNIPAAARKYLIASPGHKLFAADYAQIELRIIAHLSQDPKMLETFHQGISPPLVTLKVI